MTSLGASLRKRTDLRVLSVAATSVAAQQLSQLQFDVLIFDLAAARPESAIELWKTRPQLVLIGVDLMTGQALVLSGQESRVLTTDDLVKVIES